MNKKILVTELKNKICDRTGGFQNIYIALAILRPVKKKTIFDDILYTVCMYIDNIYNLKSIMVYSYVKNFSRIYMNTHKHAQRDSALVVCTNR